MEAWYRRVKIARIAMLLITLILAGGSLALLAWFIITVATRQDAKYQLTIIVLALLPVPYLLCYLFGMKKGYSFLRRVRLARRMRKIPPGEHPYARAVEVWSWLPLHRRAFYGPAAYALAKEKDAGWSKLAEADNDSRLATGRGFDALLLLETGSVNFIAGELPGIGTWLCASRRLVEELKDEELMAALIHELFHGGTGELRARNAAFDLLDLGDFSTSFIIYYVGVALVLSSVPANWALSELPLLALLVLLLWISIKLCGRIALIVLFPAGSCTAADAYARHVVSDPVSIAASFVASLRYSVERSGRGQAQSGGERHVSSFMYAPLVKGKRAARRQLERVEALRMMQHDGEGRLSPEIREMNRRIDAAAEETRALYDRQRAKPRGILAAVIAYTALLASIVIVLGIGTGKNFLPVRLYLDWMQGGPNTVAEEPSAAGFTVMLYGSAGGIADEYLYVAPSYLNVEVGETVTWVNQDDEGHVIVGEDIPRSPAIGPGEAYSVSINRSGMFTYRVLDPSGGGEEAAGEVSAHY